MRIKNYLQATRFRTIPLSISGVIVGSSLSYSKGYFDWKIFIMGILTTVGFQIISNFANDYGDAVKGADDDRIGQERLVSSGKISPGQMKYAIVIAIVFTLILSSLLIYKSFGKDHFWYLILFFSLAVLAIIAAIKYTVGERAYGYRGLGDVFVFVFFGLLSVVGTYFLYVKRIDLVVFLPAISVGLLSTSVLNLNNMRDRDNDKKVGKNTLVVIMGMRFSKYYHHGLILSSLVFAVFYVLLTYKNTFQFLFTLAYIPLISHLFFVAKNQKAILFDKELKKVAMSTFLFAVLFGLGQVL